MIWGSQDSADLFGPGSLRTFLAEELTLKMNACKPLLVLYFKTHLTTKKRWYTCAFRDLNRLINNLGRPLLSSFDLEQNSWAATFWAKSWSWAQNSLNSCVKSINLANHKILRWYNTENNGQRGHKGVITVSHCYNDLQWNLSCQGKKQHLALLSSQR